MPPKLPLQWLVAGGIAGALSRTLVAPFERLRTIMQASSLHMRPAAHAMWQDGGFFGKCSSLSGGNSLAKHTSDTMCSLEAQITVC